MQYKVRIGLGKPEREIIQDVRQREDQKNMHKGVEEVDKTKKRRNEVRREA